MVDFKDINLKNVVIGCVTSDNQTLDYSTRAIKWLNENTNSKIPGLSKTVISNKFACSEYDPQLPALSENKPNIEGKDIYLFAIPNVSFDNVTPNDLIARAIIASGNINQFNPKSINLIFTDLPFGRAERCFYDEKQKIQRASTVKTLAIALKSCGINSIITADTHTPKISRIFEDIYGYNPIHEINFKPLFAHYLVNHSPLSLGNQFENCALLAVDKGAEPIIEEMLEILKQVYGKTEVIGIYLDKLRKIPNNPFAVEAIVNKKKTGYVSIKDRHVYKIDDMVDTAGSDYAASNVVQDKGIECNGKGFEKPLSYSNISTHAVLAGLGFDDSQARLAAGKPREIVLTNTHPFIEKAVHLGIKNRTTIIYTSYWFAAAIACHNTKRDVNDIFKRKGKIDPVKIAKYFGFYRSKDMYNTDFIQG